MLFIGDTEISSFRTMKNVFFYRNIVLQDDEECIFLRNIVLQDGEK